MKLSLEDLTILRNALDQTKFPKDARRKSYLSLYNRIKKLESQLIIKAYPLEEATEYEHLDSRLSR